ncbi:MAG: serine hydrolase [Bryobacteraceae bacterium]
MLRHATILFVLLALAFRVSADEQTLQSRVKQKLAAFPGSVTLYAKNLRTGSTFGIQGERPVRTASTIKLAIIVECFAEAPWRGLRNRPAACSRASSFAWASA